MINSKKKKVLLVLGSGRMVEPFLDYILKREENHIILVSIEKEACEKFAQKSPVKIKPYILDVLRDKEEFHNLVKLSDIIVSFLPSNLDFTIAKSCVLFVKKMISTNYLTEDIIKLNEATKDTNNLLLFECGCNPGLDHILAYKIFAKEQKLGNKVISYENWTGALPSPEHLDNPVLYKFTWNPMQSLLEFKTDARQFINGKIVKINENILLTNIINDKRFHPALNIEGIYNRDSLK